MSLTNENSTSPFLKNIDKYKLIAHRLGFIMEGYPENSLDNLVSLFKKPKTLDLISGIEFDIQFTKDHVPVLIHDFNTADISDTAMVIRKSNFEDLKSIKCGYRRSNYLNNIPWKENKNFSIQSLEEVLAFFLYNKDKLKNKSIKI